MVVSACRNWRGKADCWQIFCEGRWGKRAEWLPGGIVRSVVERKVSLRVEGSTAGSNRRGSQSAWGVMQ